MRNQAGNQQPLPVQPVENPILCNPFEEPTEYWEYDRATGAAKKQPGRRPARYWYKTRQQARAAAQGQFTLELDEDQDILPLINALREDVKRWRKSDYEGATNVTKELLRYWKREDRLRRLFYGWQTESRTAKRWTSGMPSASLPGSPGTTPPSERRIGTNQAWNPRSMLPFFCRGEGRE